MVRASSGTASSSPKRVVVGRGAELSPVEIVVSRGVGFSGRVLDADDRGVAGAHVSLFAADPRAGKLSSARGCEVRCDDQGRFRFDRIEPVPVRAELLARTGGWQSEIVALDLGTSALLDDVVLRMQPAGTLRVSVIDTDGRVAAAPMIEWSAIDATPWDVESSEGAQLAPRAEIAARRARRGVEDQPGDGARVIRLSAGRYFVRASNNGSVSSTRRVDVESGAETSVRLDLVPAVLLLPHIDGKVLSELRGLRFRAVDASGTPSADVQELRGHISDSIMLPPGVYRLEVRASDGRHAEREVDATTRPTQGYIDVNLELRP